MKAQIIRIGNSRGIRIPKAVIEQCRFDTEVDLEIDDQKLIVSPVERPRADWDSRFQTMAASAEDQLLIETDLSTWDAEEWEW